MRENRSVQQTDRKTYWAFISYSSKDKKWGRWLHKRLENYVIPEEFQGLKLKDGTAIGKNLRPVFRDRDELSGSAELGPAITAALEQSRFLIVLCSPNSAKSEWVNKEILDFRAIHGEDNVLALILDGEPNASSNPTLDDSLECFPPALRSPLEPLAGDLRAEGDGKERGFLKILAGIADIGFDDLYRRHERAQRKRRMLLATVATAIIAALAGLSVFALNQKSIAEAQTEIAQAQTKIAEDKTIVANEQTIEAERQTGIANTQTEVAKKQTEIAEEKTREANRQAGIARTQTVEAKKQKALAESNARETSRKLAQHYQYRANELLISADTDQQTDNAMQATVLLTEAMRISKPFRESIAEKIKLQTLLSNKRIPQQLFHHQSPQSFTVLHHHLMLTCGKDQTVQLWDGRKEQQIGRTLSFDKPLTNAVFSQDGNLVAVFDAKYTWVINCGSGELIAGPLEIDSSYQYADKNKLYSNRPEASQVAFVGANKVAVMCSTALKVFNTTSGNVLASVKKPEGYIFKNFNILDHKHLWVNLLPGFGSSRNLQHKHQIVSFADGSVVREPAQGPSRLIAAMTGTAMVFEDDVIYLQQLVEDKRLIEFPKLSRKFVDAVVSPESTVFLAWYKDGDKTQIHIADVAGQKITVPPLEREKIFTMFLLDDQHMLVAYAGSKENKYQRRLEVWDFRTGQLIDSTPIEEFPDRCTINKNTDKVVFSRDHQIWFWNFKNGVHRLTGGHLSDVKHLAFVDFEHCLSSDEVVAKKWKLPTPEPPEKRITWARGKFDAVTSKLAFGDDLIAFTSEENEKHYFSVYDEKQQRLIADSIHVADASRFHWTPLRFSSNSEFLLVPYWAEGNKKSCFIWDTKSQQPAKLKLPVPIRQVVRIDSSEVVYLGDDNQIHFHSFSKSEHKSLKLGPLRDGRIQWSPDRKCIVVEGAETAFIINLDKRSVVFDAFFFRTPNETCWLADENAVWCIAKKQFCKINWLTGEVLIERQVQDSIEDLTCLAGRDMLISKSTEFDGRVRRSTSLKFWDLAGNDLGIVIPFNDKQEFYRSADDRFVHVPGGDSFTTVSTADREIQVRSDSFIRENLKIANMYIGDNRNHLVIWPRNGKYRVYDTSTLTPISKPFSIQQRGFVKSSAAFDTFRIGGEIMTLSTREKIDFYQTTTGYKINSILVKDYLDVGRDLKRSFRVLKGRGDNQVILVNEKKNEMALVDLALGNLTYESASLQSAIVAEQRVDATNAVVPMSKKEVIGAFEELQKLRQQD